MGWSSLWLQEGDLFEVMREVCTDIHEFFTGYQSQLSKLEMVLPALMSSVEPLGKDATLGLWLPKPTVPSLVSGEPKYITFKV